MSILHTSPNDQSVIFPFSKTKKISQFLTFPKVNLFILFCFFIASIPGILNGDLIWYAILQGKQFLRTQEQSLITDWNVKESTALFAPQYITPHVVSDLFQTAQNTLGSCQFIDISFNQWKRNGIINLQTGTHTDELFLSYHTQIKCEKKAFPFSADITLAKQNKGFLIMGFWMHIQNEGK